MQGSKALKARAVTIQDFSMAGLGASRESLKSPGLHEDMEKSWLQSS